jgi:hypothetical protein
VPRGTTHPCFALAIIRQSQLDVCRRYDAAVLLVQLVEQQVERRAQLPDARLQRHRVAAGLAVRAGDRPMDLWGTTSCALSPSTPSFTIAGTHHIIICSQPLDIIICYHLNHCHLYVWMEMVPAGPCGKQ